MDRPSKDFLVALLSVLLGVAAAFACLFFFGKWGILVGPIAAILIINLVTALYKRAASGRQYHDFED